MHIFDYSFLENGLLPADICNLTASIFSLNTGNMYRKDSYPVIFSELEKVAKVQSVKTSNAIEGILTSDERIRAIVTGSSAPRNHDEAEIAGYRDALNLIHNSFKTLQFDEKNIRQLHRILLSLTADDTGGEYKTDDNVIVEINADGSRNVRFRPVSAAETEFAMDQLVLACICAQNSAEINPILLIPCVILDFLCIHPFRDGNGRMSRLLTLLLLYKNGFDAGKYISFEEQINNRKNKYYEALQKSSDGWHENKNDYMPFIRNFLTTLFMCYRELDKRFAVVNGTKATKSSRIENTILNSLTPLSKKDICNFLPDVSISTVEAVLAELVKNGSVIKVGNARNTKYVRA